MPDGSAPRSAAHLTAADPDPAPALPSQAPALPCLGRVVGVDADGRPLVWFAGLQGSPPIARLIGVVPPQQLEDARRDGRLILIGFLDGRADAPVIMSLASMADLPAPEPELEPESDAAPDELVAVELARGDALELEVDGQPGEHVIEAREQLVLRCGDASITLSADGTVRVVGRDITSWARRRQRIRGGSVAIN